MQKVQKHQYKKSCSQYTCCYKMWDIYFKYWILHCNFLLPGQDIISQRKLGTQIYIHNNLVVSSNIFGMDLDLSLRQRHPFKHNITANKVYFPNNIEVVQLYKILKHVHDFSDNISNFSYSIIIKDIFLTTGSATIQYITNC